MPDDPQFRGSGAGCLLFERLHQPPQRRAALLDGFKHGNIALKRSSNKAFCSDNSEATHYFRSENTSLKGLFGCDCQRTAERCLRGEPTEKGSEPHTTKTT